MAWLIAYPLQFGVVLYRSLPVLGVTISRHLRAIGVPAVSATLMYLVVASTRSVVNHLLLSGTLTLIVLVLTGALSYLAMIFLLERDLLRDVVQLSRT